VFLKQTENEVLAADMTEWNRLVDGTSEMVADMERENK